MAGCRWMDNTGSRTNTDCLFTPENVAVTKEFYKGFIECYTNDMRQRGICPCFLVETSPAAPWQVEGVCADGRFIYIRERRGRCTVRMAELASELYRSAPVLEFDVPENWTNDEIIRHIEKELGLLLIVVNEAWDM